MNRLKLLILWILCCIFTPILLLAQFINAIIGSEERSKSMAIAFDECGNSLFGGSPSITISERTGNGVILGYIWAIKLAPIIDFFFGIGHCSSQATLK